MKYQKSNIKNHEFLFLNFKFSLNPRTLKFPNPSFGFTLLELIVSIAIFAIISTFVYGAYTGTVATTERAQKKIEIYQKARLVLGRISEELEQTEYIHDFDNMDYSHLSGFNDEINGINADELSFVSRFNTNYSRDSGDPALMRIHYTLEPASDEEEGYFVLVRREDPVFYREDEEYEKAEEFLGDCEGINFEYYSDDGWVDEWDDQIDQVQQGKLPKAIRITLTLKDIDGKIRDFTTTVSLPQGG